MKKVNWNNELGSSSRKAVALIVSPTGEIFPFKGETIPNVCHAQDLGYVKNGKWSYSRYLVTLPDGTDFVAFHEDFNTGLVWPQTSWTEALQWLQSRAPQVTREEFEKYIRKNFTKTTARFDEQQRAEELFSKKPAETATPQSEPPQ